MPREPSSKLSSTVSGPARRRASGRGAQGSGLAAARLVWVPVPSPTEVPSPRCHLTTWRLPRDPRHLAQRGHRRLNEHCGDEWPSHVVLGCGGRDLTGDLSSPVTGCLHCSPAALTWGQVSSCDPPGCEVVCVDPEDAPEAGCLALPGCGLGVRTRSLIVESAPMTSVKTGVLHETPLVQNRRRLSSTLPALHSKLTDYAGEER